MSDAHVRMSSSTVFVDQLEIAPQLLSDFYRRSLAFRTSSRMMHHMRLHTKELLASAIPGKPPRQAPRFFMLAALEDMVVSAEAPTCWRVMSWWIHGYASAGRPYASMNHRGMVPTELEVAELGLLGKLKRSKVHWTGHKAQFSTPCYPRLRQRSSEVLDVDAGGSCWKLGNNYRGFKNKELSYQVAFAVQTRILAFATYRGQRIF